MYKQMKHSLPLDPRSKLALLLVVSIFVLGGAGGQYMYLIRPILSFIPFLLLIYEARFKQAFTYLVSYSIFFIAQLVLLPITKGFANSLILLTSGFFCRFLPGVMMGEYVISTTTVSEFMASMERMHVPNFIVIPLSVVFRFTPTVLEEAGAINDAMRMRGIGIGGKHVGKMMEYRVIPLITCSAKIGDELSAAALSRGLGGPIKRTNICDIGFKAIDYVVFIFSLTIVVGACL